MNILTDESSTNRFCIDCFSTLFDAKELKSAEARDKMFSRIFVSINHGVFLCHNCAQIHQAHYGAEISFIKSIADPHLTGLVTDPNQKSSWTFTQLRVLIISGGNLSFRDYMDNYNLLDSPVQKRYSTVAAEYYRDVLKNKIRGNNQKNLLVQRPDFDEGRKRSNRVLSFTKQVCPYSNLDTAVILKDLLVEVETN